MPTIDMHTAIAIDDRWRSFFWSKGACNVYWEPKTSWTAIELYAGGSCNVWDHRERIKAGYSMEDAQYSRLMTLLGPHWETILRIWCVKHDISLSTPDQEVRRFGGGVLR